MCQVISVDLGPAPAVVYVWSTDANILYPDTLAPPGSLIMGIQRNSGQHSTVSLSSTYQRRRKTDMDCHSSHLPPDCRGHDLWKTPVCVMEISAATHFYQSVTRAEHQQDSSQALKKSWSSPEFYHLDTHKSPSRKHGSLISKEDGQQTALRQVQGSRAWLWRNPAASPFINHLEIDQEELSCLSKDDNWQLLQIHSH